MGKFNESRTLKSVAESHPMVTSNFEGGTTYKLSPLMALYTRVSTALMGDRVIEMITILERPEADVLAEIRKVEV
jgi:hypothetical protein